MYRRLDRSSSGVRSLFPSRELSQHGVRVDSDVKEDTDGNLGWDGQRLDRYSKSWNDIAYHDIFSIGITFPLDGFVFSTSDLWTAQPSSFSSHRVTYFNSRIVLIRDTSQAPGHLHIMF